MVRDSLTPQQVPSVVPLQTASSITPFPSPVSANAPDDERNRAGSVPERIGLVFADGHPIVLQGMQYVLKAEPGFEVLACCTNDDDAYAAVLRHRPDILVVELNLPQRGGLPLVR